MAMINFSLILKILRIVVEILEHVTGTGGDEPPKA